MQGSHFIFYDSHRRRWRRLRIVLYCGACVVFAGLVVFIKSLVVSPRLSGVQQINGMVKNLKALHQTHAAQTPTHLPPAWMKGTAKHAGVSRYQIKDEQSGSPVRLGFYAGWDPASFVSLQENGDALTHLAPEWFSITGMPPVLSATPDEHVRDYAREHHLKLLPQVTNLRDTWQPEAIEALLTGDPERRREFWNQLVQALNDIDAAGAVVDFQEIDPMHRDAMTEGMRELGDALHDAGIELWLCIPPGNDIATYDLDGLAPIVDRFVALLYDENGEHDEPGPIASVPWFRAWLDVLIAHGDPQQWVAGIGAYGYDRREGAPARMVAFADCMARAAYAGLDGLDDDAELRGPSFIYEEAGEDHSVWFLDGVTFHNHALCAARKGTGGIALNRLGCEDPAVWRVMRSDTGQELADFEDLSPDKLFANLGDGDFMTAFDERRPGKRVITADAEGLWHARYTVFPRTPVLAHHGAAEGDQVALTFDDGPDPEWTPKILDILKEHGVPAAFFLVGEHARRHPDLVRRIVAEGHEIGNHTYNHIELTDLPEALIRLELNATQRIVESITGHSTVLFRPPYNADRQLGSVAEMQPLLTARQLGYVTVGYSIDGEDWNAPDEAAILQRIEDRRGEGTVVLLHDGGGDRAATVAALPQVIRYLQRRGDRIVPLHRLLGVPAASLMPTMQPADAGGDLHIVNTGFSLLCWAEQICWAFMIAITVMIICRTVLLVTLAVRSTRRHGLQTAAVCEPVSVLIAAHNEEKVIAATLRSLAAVSYCDAMEVIVVDDGSTDQTAAVVGRFAAQDPRIRLIRQAQQGKAAALNAGLAAALHEIIVTMDADTQCLPDTITALLRPFGDPRVGAVSGHVRVGNTRSWLARFQELEYVCGFNLDRRAYDLWNCVTVVPGALSAFRKRALRDAGGLSDDTLAEDTDLTLTLHRLGYVVRFAPDAVAFTEAPETVGGLVRQRIRWAFGTLQCLYKHRALLGWTEHKALGFFSLPGVWIFHYGLVALIPCIDLLLAFSLATGAGRAVADYALAFLGFDLLIAAAACRIDGTPLRRAWRIVPMRLLYRPVLAWAVWTALIRALKGVWVAWGRQERRGAAILPLDPVEARTG